MKHSVHKKVIRTQCKINRKNEREDERRNTRSTHTLQTELTFIKIKRMDCQRNRETSALFYEQNFTNFIQVENSFEIYRAIVYMSVMLLCYVL